MIDIQSLPYKFLLISFWFVNISGNLLILIGIIFYIKNIASWTFTIFYGSTITYFSLGGLLYDSINNNKRIIIYIESILSLIILLIQIFIIISLKVYLSINDLMNQQQLIYPFITFLLSFFLFLFYFYSILFPLTIPIETGRIDIQNLENKKNEKYRIILSIILWIIFIIGYLFETIYFICGIYDLFIIRIFNSFGLSFLLSSLGCFMFLYSHPLQYMSIYLKRLIYFEFLLFWLIPFIHIFKLLFILLIYYNTLLFDSYFYFFYSYLFSRMYIAILYFVSIFSISMFHFRELLSQRFREYFIIQQ